MNSCNQENQKKCEVQTKAKTTRPMNYPFCCSPSGFNVPQFRLTKVQEVQLLEKQLTFVTLDDFWQSFCRKKFTYIHNGREFRIVNPEFIFELERITKEKNSCPFHSSFLYDLKKGFIKIALSLRIAHLGMEIPSVAIKFWISR